MLSGLKLNLRSTLSKIPENAFSKSECAHPAYPTLVFTLAFFHAVVQERRKYGKIGWNISYDFNENDFSVCMMLTKTYLNKSIENNDEKIPFDSLKYLVGQVMYGGRVIDDFDRRIVTTYMHEFMGDFLFDTFQKFHFYQDDTVDYYTPDSSDRATFIQYVETLPLANTPSVFGLHPNAEIGYFTDFATTIWEQLVELQPQTGSADAGISREAFISQIASGILTKLPEVFDLARVRNKYGLNPSPTQIVLMQEMERWNNLLTAMRRSLAELQKALAGEVGMSQSLDDLSRSLFNGQIPALWRRLAPDTFKSLGNWMVHFDRRYQQYKDWLQMGEPAVMWISGLHIPESYLTALVQTTCRAKVYDVTNPSVTSLTPL